VPVAKVLLRFVSTTISGLNYDFARHTLYERLVEAGKPKMCALGAAMRKLVHICYGVYKNQQPYQPQVTLT
jgi:hypothetical protein